MVNNKNLIYDIQRKRYSLNIDYVLNNMGDLQEILYDETDPNPSTLPERTIKRTSNNVYEFLKRHSRDFDYNCERIEDEEDINYAFQDALQYQLEDFVYVGERAFGEHDKLISERVYDILKSNGLLDKKRPICFTAQGVYDVRTIKQ